MLHWPIQLVFKASNRENATKRVREQTSLKFQKETQNLRLKLNPPGFYGICLLHNASLLSMQTQFYRNKRLLPLWKEYYSTCLFHTHHYSFQTCMQDSLMFSSATRLIEIHDTMQHYVISATLCYLCIYWFLYFSVQETHLNVTIALKPYLC